MYINLQPPSQVYNPQNVVPFPSLLRNADSAGTFSSGALSGSVGPWVLYIEGSSDAEVVIDNITIYRQDSNSNTSTPPAWSRLDTLPYPRLGQYMIATTYGQAYAGGLTEGPALRVSVEQVEGALAFGDVILGINPDAQTQSPDSIRRLRQLNPNAVILPYRIAEEQGQDIAPTNDSGTSLEYQFLEGVPDSWYLRNTEGSYVPDPSYPFIRKMNISPYCPILAGQTYFSYLLSWLGHPIFSSGVWDGVFLDNLFGAINVHILNFQDPSSIDVDYKGDGIRETPAWINNMTRTAAVGMLQQLHSVNGDMQLVVGNAGNTPEIPLAPDVNGYLFECANGAWNPGVENGNLELAVLSQAGWRSTFDSYRVMQETVRLPRINVIQGCGVAASGSGLYSAPTTADLQNHRFTMGTALLSDGFYGYALHGARSAPLWFDEYSVDSTGTAVQDLKYKGYLGQPVTDAVELTSPGILELQENFEGGVLPASFIPNPVGAVSISQNASDVIAGKGSLVLNNQDHTKNGYVYVALSQSAVTLQPGSTYLLVFDWRILETLDARWGLQVSVTGPNGTLDSASANQCVSGDSGTISFPFTMPASGNWGIRFAITGGGGKAAIDNIRIFQGGVGPWRRDFENGFVLVNPLSQPHTFSMAEIAGMLNRTGIKRLKGTQAADINNGQAISGALTLPPFDSVVLLADPMRFGAPVVTGVANAAGGQVGVASGAYVSIYGANFTPMTYDDWSKSINNGRLPTQLDGVRVTVGGKPAYVSAVTPAQINVQAPDVGAGAVQIVVSTPGGSSPVFTANAQSYGPAFFLWPGSQPVATHADYTLAAKDGTFQSTNTAPAKPGEVTLHYGGPDSAPPTLCKAVAALRLEPTSTAPPTVSSVEVSLGGVPISVVAAVLSSYAAEYQIAIQIPSNLADGDYPVVASVGGSQSPSTVILTVRH